MPRDLCLTRMNFGATQFIMESLIDSWGEDDPIVGSCVDDKFDENETLSYWAYLVESAAPGELFLDVGSYAGLFSLVAARINPLVKIAAFEASAVTYGRLVKNILLNSVETAVCAAHVAAWNETTFLEFAHRYGIYTMCPGDSMIPPDAEVDHTESVFTLPLDNLLSTDAALPGVFGSRSLGVRRPRDIAAIKIDVESAESRVLSGSREILSQQRPHILCELLTEETVTATTNFINNYDYLVTRIGEERNYHLAPREKLSNFNDGYQAWVIREGSLKLNADRYLVLRLTP